jgi:CRP-like cAMP-binding protein
VRAWDAWAREPTRLLKVPVEVWFDLFEEHFDLVISTRVVLARERDAILEQLAAEAGPAGLVLT